MSSGVGLTYQGQVTLKKEKKKKGGPGARGQRIVLHKLHVLTQTTPILDSTPCKQLSSCSGVCGFFGGGGGGKRGGGGRTSGVG